MPRKSKNFLAELQSQAQLQAKLSSTHVLPKQLDPLSTLIGNYPWQFVLISSGISAFLWTLVGK